jgi:hypothetical protein
MHKNIPIAVHTVKYLLMMSKKVLETYRGY